MSMRASLLIGVLWTVRLMVHVWLVLRQLQALRKNRADVPTVFVASFSLSEHQRATDYQMARLKFSLLKYVFNALLLALWLFSGALNTLDAMLFELVPHPIWQPLALLGAVSLIDMLSSLPWAFYSQFSLEERFGFNRSTLQLFILDRLKGLALFTLLGFVVGYPLIMLMHNVPGFWWLPALLLYTFLQFSLLWLWPTLIAPLFNKFTPLEDPGLRDRIAALVEAAGFHSQGVYVMDASKRSSHGNAYFTGIGKAKRIVFFDTLLKTLSHEQTLAVLAHEIGHLAHGHIRKGLQLSLVMSLVAFVGLGWLSLQPKIFWELGLSPTHGVLLIIASWLGGLLSFPLTPLLSWWSRKHEFEADRYAIERSSSLALSTALIQLYRDNAASLVVDPIYAAWNYSHPPLAERIVAMNQPTKA